VKILPLTRLQRTIFITLALLIGDSLAFIGAFWLAYLLRFKLIPYFASYRVDHYGWLIAFCLPILLLILAIYQLYSPQVLFGGLQEYSRAFNAVTMGMLAVVGIDFLVRPEDLVSRGWVVITWTLALGFIWAFRFGFRRVVYALRSRGHLLSPAIIVGANSEGLALADQLRKWSTSGLYILGFMDDSLLEGTSLAGNTPVLGSLADLERIIQEKQVRDVIIAQTALEREELLGVFQTVTRLQGVTLRLSSGLFEIVSSGLRVKELASVPLVEVGKTRISGMDSFIKGGLDYCLTIMLLVIALPVMALIALLIRLDSPGLVFHRRRVMGVNGTQFDAYKFRTMDLNGKALLVDRPDLQTELAANFKLKDDPRVTRVGKILRKLSMDELPQLFNVLLGQMSLVGPRMISPPEMEKYGKWGLNLLTVKPGLTGLWQVNGRADVDYSERVLMDMRYIRNWSIWQDIFLIIMTVPAVLKKRGAY